jgi:hypothetical protein
MNLKAFPVLEISKTLMLGGTYLLLLVLACWEVLVVSIRLAEVIRPGLVQGLGFSLLAAVLLASVPIGLAWCFAKATKGLSSSLYAVMVFPLCFNIASTLAQWAFQVDVALSHGMAFRTFFSMAATEVGIATFGILVQALAIMVISRFTRPVSTSQNLKK